jgi:hypothetical protein
MTVAIFESWVLPFSPKIAKVVMDHPDVLRRVIKSDVSKDVKSFLFGCRPFIHADIVHSVVSEDGEPVLLLAEDYLASLRLLTSLSTFSSWWQNGWVEFVSSGFSGCEDLLSACKKLVSDCSDECAAVLAYATDFEGRVAMDVAIPELKAALRARLLFLARFKLAPGPPVHQSATCVVRKATDHGAMNDYRVRCQECLCLCPLCLRLCFFVSIYVSWSLGLCLCLYVFMSLCLYAFKPL